MKSSPLIIAFVLLLIPEYSFSVEVGSDRQSYIDQWKDVAVEQMHLYGIPASITMAQAILESGNGKSMLSVKANNHFGIKCHGWDGPGVYKDDDKKDECFRKYKTARESFEDHSLFLKKQRYAFLFKYDITDYKSWAKGLKKAGYATDPSYAKRLIRLIEDNKLHKLDTMPSMASNKKAKKSKARYEQKRDSASAVDVIEVSLTRKVRLHSNTIKYIEAEAGETAKEIAVELEMAPWQIKKYNDLESGHVYKGGETVFIQPKKNKNKKASHTVKKGESLLDISQYYGVKLKKLEEYNSTSAAEDLGVGKQILLRKPKK